jgi:Ca2+-transporting ATPase
MTPFTAMPTPPRTASATVAEAGLSTHEAERRLAEFGANEIRRARATPPLMLFVRQFQSPVIWLLLVACAVSILLGELIDAGAIAAIVVINAVIGFLQEHRAERAVLALRALTAPRARVVRDGRSVILPAATVVPGDLLVLEAGDVVAADAILQTVHALSMNEAALTGESTPVDKRTSPSPPHAVLAERHNMVFMGTAVAAGTGTAVVTATGMTTELGRIAHLLDTAEHSVTPLQQRLARVSRSLLHICGGIVVLVAVAGLLRGWAVLEVFMAAV